MLKLETKGSPKEQGQQHGESFRKQIHELAEIRLKLLWKDMKGWTREDLNWMAMRELQALGKFPEIHDEFVGIAEGAAIPLFDLAFLNNYTDMRDLGCDPNVTPPSRRDEGCSIFSVLGKDRAICGQTWDMHGSAEPFMLHLSKEATGDTARQEVLTVTGCVGLAGVNEHSLCIMINNLRTNETSVGLIWPVLVRKMLELKSAKEASSFLTDNMPSSGHNYLICDPAETLNIETTGKRFQLTYGSRDPGIYFHTNHYLGNLKETEVPEKISRTSHARYDALEKYFKDFDPNQATRTGLEEAIFRGEPSKSVCIPRSKTDPHASATCGGITFDLYAKEGVSFGGVYSDNDHFQFKWS